VAGQAYQGMSTALEVGTVEVTAGTPDRRLTLRLGTVPMALRSRFLQDDGPRPVRVKLARVTRTSGASPQGTVLQTMHAGRLSTASMQHGVLTVEVETRLGDVDRGVPLQWSHEDQQRRYPGDLGLEHMRALARGGITGAWPP